MNGVVLVCLLRIFRQILQVVSKPSPLGVIADDLTCLEAAGTSEIRLWDPKREAVGDVSLFLSMSKEPEDSDEEPEDNDVESDDVVIDDRDYYYENLTPLWDSVLHQSYPLLRILGQCLDKDDVFCIQHYLYNVLRKLVIYCSLPMPTLAD